MLVYFQICVLYFKFNPYVPQFFFLFLKLTDSKLFSLLAFSSAFEYRY